MKEIKDDINRWRDIPCYWDGRTNIVKNDYTAKYNLQIKFNPCQIPIAFFTELEQKFSQFVCKQKRLQIAKATSRKKGGAGGINLPDFRLSYKATVIKTVCYQQKKTRHTDQQNKTESPEKTPHTYGHLVFEKGGKNI